MKDPVVFGWLGVSGVELTYGERRLVIDPFVTRFPLRQILSRVKPDTDLIARTLNHPDAILVTHSHWDHLFDVAELARLSGCQVFGSANTCRILTLQGIEASRVHETAAGDHFSIAGFDVEVFPGSHINTPLDHWLNAPLPSGLHAPLRPVDFHKDTILSFRIRAGATVLLHGLGDTTAEVSILGLYHTHEPTFYHRLRQINPRLLIPVHWENFMRPLSRPLSPMVEPLHPPFPWVHRVNLAAITQEAQTHLPGLQVLVPQLFTPYDLDSLLNLNQRPVKDVQPVDQKESSGL